MIEPNTLLQNRYRVVKQIGQGGMGAVYIATDERFGSTVAVKQTFFDDPTLRKAFEREAHLLNHLRHTALPKVSDHFTEGEGQFLVMEFIEGSDLSELLQQRGGAFPIAEVLAWADELLDALEYLHTQQPPVVHRDIKPQNMKLTTRGHIALLDFGLAKGTPAQTRANATASVFGYSRNYAPLEQIQGTGTDTRSDLYSLSATLYHLLTGKAPVDALTRASALVNGQPDPLRPAHVVHAQVPAAVGEILKRAMSQNAAHRQATAAEMRAALRRAAAALPNTARQAGAAFTKPTTDVATILEPTTQAAYGQPSPTGTRATTQLRPPNAGAPLSETTITDAQAARRPRPSMNSFVPPSHEPPAQKSTAKLIGVALAVVAACALIAFPLMRRDNATPATELKIETPRDAPADAQSAAPDATQSVGARETPNTSSASDTTSTQTQSRTLRETPATTNQSATGDTETTVVSEAKDSGSNATGNESGNGSTAVGASASRSQGLVLQGPNPQSGVRNTAAAEYDAQRAEELKRRQQQQQERPRQPHPDEGHYGPPPPHHDGRRPPPRRPPPFP